MESRGHPVNPLQFDVRQFSQFQFTERGEGSAAQGRYHGNALKGPAAALPNRLNRGAIRFSGGRTRNSRRSPRSRSSQAQLCIRQPPFHRNARSERATSNCSDGVNTPDLDEIFNELERWHDLLKDHDKSFLRGPRP